MSRTRYHPYRARPYQTQWLADETLESSNSDHLKELIEKDHLENGEISEGSLKDESWQEIGLVARKSLTPPRKESPSPHDTPSIAPRNRSQAEDLEQAILRRNFARLEQAKEESQAALPQEYLVFRVASRRYAIPQRFVIEQGRLSVQNQLKRRLPFQNQELPLLDAKKVLGISGESGTLYLVLRVQRQLKCLVIDGLESTQVIDPREIRQPGLLQVVIAGKTRGQHIIRGIYSDRHTGSYRSSKQPICVINPLVL